MSNETVPSTNHSNKLQFSLDLRLLCIALLLVIVAMLAVWRPWTTQPTNAARTISVTGESTVKATPDEYVFMPQYDFKDADKAAALASLTAKQDEVVTALKKLGVAEDKIKADSSGYDYGYYYDETARTNNYTLGLTITLSDKTLTQKVQDYLVTTSPTGSVSPQANFSDAKRKQLEGQGRDAATKEARAKADQTAQNLGFKVGAVKSVDDSAGSGSGGCGVGGLCTSSMMGVASDAKTTAAPSLAVQSGQNELSYSVTVVYYVK